MTSLASLSDAPTADRIPPQDSEPQSLCESLKGFSLLALGDDASANLYLIHPAEEITHEAVNFLAINGRGLICLAITAMQALRLRVPPMVADPTNPRCASFGRSIEAKTGVSTGISAADRARTLRLAANPDARPSELVSPGHIFPIIVHEDDISVAAAALAVFKPFRKRPAVAMCQVLLNDGNVATLADLADLAWARDMPVQICDQRMTGLRRY